MRRFPKRQHKEFSAFKKLNSPVKIQNFLDAIPINFEVKKETCRSPLFVLRHNEAHCMEGALLAAAILWYHGEQPLLLDLKTNNDDDHVVTLFRQKNDWGAISKTNHSVLRYRDPVYKTVRELAMSYFNEYFTDEGEKTLRSYSRPFSLLRYTDDWLAANQDLWYISDELDSSPHAAILKNNSTRLLRKANPLEIKTSKFTEWQKCFCGMVRTLAEITFPL